MSKRKKIRKKQKKLKQSKKSRTSNRYLSLIFFTDNATIQAERGIAMKKLLTVIISVVLVLSMSISAFAVSDIANSFANSPTNYTANVTVSVVFEDTSDILQLLDEIEIPEEISYFVDLDMLLTSLYTENSKMRAQVDFSDDFEKIKAGITFDTEQDVNVNSNLNIGIKSKAGIWADIDLSDETSPKFDVIASLPITNKYFCIDLAEYLDEDAVATIKGMYSKEFFDKINTSCGELMEKYFKISKTRTGLSMIVDNEGFTSFCDGLMPIVMDVLSEMAGVDPLPDYEMLGLPKFTGMQFLGKNGIRATYTASNGIITSGKEVADISIDMSQIYEVMTGEKWQYNASGKLNMTITDTVEISKIGSTAVEFPKLTEDNSVSLNELIADSSPSYDGSVYEEAYPNFYVAGYTDNLPVVNGEIYVPLRMTLEEAYDNTVTIDYKNGNITAACEYFPGFKTLSMKVGDNKVYADKEYVIGKIMLINNSTYVSSKLFTEIFGWEFGYANHDLVSDEYSYVFYTE